LKIRPQASHQHRPYHQTVVARWWSGLKASTS